MKSQLVSILLVISIYNIRGLGLGLELGLGLNLCKYNNQILASSQQNVDILGSAAEYTVLAGSQTTNAGVTTIIGSLGVSPKTDISGTAVILIGGSFHAADANSLNAQNSLTNGYNLLAGRLNALDMTGTDLVGLTLYPGVYSYTSSAFLTAGILTLNADGNANAEWVFQIKTTLITSVGAEIRIIGGGSPLNVYWQVGSSATISGSTKMIGNIVAYVDVIFGVSATLTGRALARSGQVTMLSNVLSRVTCIPL